MIRKSICIILQIFMISLAAMSAHADTNDSGVKTKWGYLGNIGPSRWGQLDPAFAACSTGKMQSPINIPKKTSTSPSALVLDYQPSPLAIVNDGETELMINKTQTIFYDGHDVQVNFSSEPVNETITFNGKDYHLVQFHIHSPSENEINNQGFPLEIHFVHQSDDGEVAVIGVFVKGGKPNASIQKILDNVPTERGKELVVQGQRIYPADLMPAKHEHYSFMGSLTTPPCTEGLQWIVMKEAITASPSQILQIRKANGGANARPAQPLHKRAVDFSV